MELQYEVELKFPLSDRDRVRRLLDEMNAEFVSEVSQKDQYFAHPVRDFGETDEALRIRSIGPENRLTYKGPVIDRATKTRHESELAFESGDTAADQLAAIWELLGFRRVRQVEKVRQTYKLTWHDRALEICFDRVVGLGDFIEVETLAREADKQIAQHAILTLAAQLQLGTPEQRSYLEILLQHDTDLQKTVC